MNQRTNGEVCVSLAEICGPTIQTQLRSFLGEDFNISHFRHALKGRSMFNEGRGVIQSFVPDADVREAQRAAYGDVYASASCQADEDEFSEQAHYRLTIDDCEEVPDKHISIEISPNALRVLHRPLNDILSDFSPHPDEAGGTRDRAAYIAYRAIYSNVLAQFMVKQHAVAEEEGDLRIKPEIIDRMNSVYENKFPGDRIHDPATRLNRLASALGGAVMLRHAASAVSTELHHDVHFVAAYPLKMFAAGLSQSKPVDQQEVRFALAHAFSPVEAADFMKYWFVGSSRSTTLRLTQ